MTRIQPTLHEAMQMLLLEAPEYTATTRFLSEENARRDLYRKGDGEHPLPSQFWVRARCPLYREWFELLRPNRIKYVGPHEQSSAQTAGTSCAGDRVKSVTGLSIEEHRHSFRPPRITTLFIGESAPPSGKFFYSGNSTLYRAMKEAFHGGDDFIAEFKSKGFFLDDLVLFPNDTLTKEQKKRYVIECRQKGYRDNIESTAQRIIMYRPQAVVVLLRQIESAALEAVEQAKVTLLDCPPKHCGTTVFPRKRHHEQFLQQMRRMIPNLPVLQRD